MGIFREFARARISVRKYGDYWLENSSINNRGNFIIYNDINS